MVCHKTFKSNTIIALAFNHLQTLKYNQKTLNQINFLCQLKHFLKGSIT